MDFFNKLPSLKNVIKDNKYSVHVSLLPEIQSLCMILTYKKKYSPNYIYYLKVLEHESAQGILNLEIIPRQPVTKFKFRLFNINESKFFIHQKSSFKSKELGPPNPQIMWNLNLLCHEKIQNGLIKLNSVCIKKFHPKMGSAKKLLKVLRVSYFRQFGNVLFLNESNKWEVYEF